MKRVDYFYCLQHTKKEQGVLSDFGYGGGKRGPTPTVATGGFLGYF